MWSGSDGVHLWAFDGEDGWKDTGWGVAVKEWKTKRGQGPSGVCLPEPVLDELVVMRLAELVDEGKVSGAIRRALKKWAGNGGALSLAYHAEAEWRMLTHGLVKFDQHAALVQKACSRPSARDNRGESAP